MSDSTNPLNQVSSTAILRETTINHNFAQTSIAATFAYDETSSGLTWGYMGGRVDGTSVASGTVALTAANTNYVVAHRTTLAVTVSTATTNWNNTLVYARLYLVVAGASTVTSYQDWRLGSSGIIAASGGGGGGGSSGITINAQTGTTYTVLSTDLAKLVTHSNASAIAVTLPQATGAFTTPFYYYTKNLGAGTVTITPTTSTINGAATLVLTTGQSVVIVSDGTNYQTALVSASASVAGSDTQIQYNNGGVFGGDARLIFDDTNKVAKGQFTVDTSGVNAQTGTTYTLNATDNGGVVTLSNAGAITVTVPSGLGKGYSVVCYQIGAGVVTFTASGTTVNSPGGLLAIGAQHGGATLIAYVADVFNLSGNLA